MLISNNKILSFLFNDVTWFCFMAFSGYSVGDQIPKKASVQPNNGDSASMERVIVNDGSRVCRVQSSSSFTEKLTELQVGIGVSFNKMKF